MNHKKDFVTYQIFKDVESSNDFIDFLNKNQIQFILDDTSSDFDPSFSFSDLNKEYRIKIEKDNFVNVDKLLTNLYSNELNNIDKDYYLFDYSHDELTDILTKPDEWNKFDYLLAVKILKDRGEEINTEIIHSIKEQRIEELSKPEENQKTWIILGYISSLLGGCIGIFIGWFLYSHKKTLPNGERVFAYRP